MRSSIILIFIALSAPVVGAQPPITVEADDAARQAVRGCPADSACYEVAGELRQFELAAFSSSPWVKSSDASLRATAPKPSSIRPDAAWLDHMVMPDLPVVWNDRLITYLQFYKSDPRGRRIMEGWLRRAGRYQAMIIETLRARGLPEDLFYVAMIESSFEITVSSYAGAAGLWQFMPDGGRAYGLRVDRWLDERLEPLRATQAATDYLADLYARFGNWHLALAAYNAGYGAMIRSIVRYNSNDYWRLADIENGMAWEASLYVPKALAVAIVGRNRAAFGFADVPSDPAESVDTVVVPARVTVGSIARLTKSTVDEIKRLNPQLRRGRTPPEGPYAIRVPRGLGQLVAHSRELEAESSELDLYHVAYGERLEDVAKLFDVSQSRIRQLNEVAHAGDIGGGTTILVPRTTRERLAQNRRAVMDDLHASGIDQQPGEPLVAPMPDKDAQVANTRRVFYRVVAGDQLAKLASVLGVATNDLATWNGMAVDAALHPRMVLQAFVAPNFSPDAANIRLLDESRILVVTRGTPEHLDILEGRIGRRRVAYTAAADESLEKIGKKYGLGPRDLARINRMPSDTIVRKGQTITVYEVVNRQRSERAQEQWEKSPKAARGKSSKGDNAKSGANAKAATAKKDKIETSSPKSVATSAKGKNAPAEPKPSAPGGKSKAPPAPAKPASAKAGTAAKPAPGKAPAPPKP